MFLPCFTMKQGKPSKTNFGGVSGTVRQQINFAGFGMLLEPSVRQRDGVSAAAIPVNFQRSAAAGRVAEIPFRDGPDTSATTSP
jgi:hypothetical protein